MRTMLAFGLLFGVLQVAAQRECATQLYIEQQKSSSILLDRQLKDAESFLYTQDQTTISMDASKTSGSNTIKIPVVIHVLYNTPAQNISDAQIQSQLKVLNDDFRKRNSDTSNIPLYFKPFASDVNIEFVLATADPKGRATTGIIRKKTSVTEWSMDDKMKFSASGGDDAWDSKSYLNIWVGNVRKILGYSSTVGSPEDKDGVVINTSAFGTINTAAPYHLGRTAVHEVGHWLGLKHIWGDAACGDDGVEDTPVQGGYTTGCPTGFRSSCSNGMGGDMYMNFMDFTNDACLNLFTEGQKERMRNTFNVGGPRSSILLSKGLNAPWLEEAQLPEEINISVKTINVYPNPAANDITLDFGGDVSWFGTKLQIIAANGSIVSKTEVKANVHKINVTALKPGVYLIQGENNGKKLAQKFVKL